MKEAIRKEATLTKRELEVMKLLRTGLSNKLIADRLSISPETVKKHLQHIYNKLGVSNKIEAINAHNGIGQ